MEPLKKRKKTKKENRRVDSGVSKMTRGNPDIFICGEAHQMRDCAQWRQMAALKKEKEEKKNERMISL